MDALAQPAYRWARAHSVVGDVDTQAAAEIIAARYRDSETWARFDIETRQASTGKWFVVARIKAEFLTP